MSAASPRKRQLPQYAVLAPFYDAVMEHVDYLRWSDHIQRLWHAQRIDPRSVLELAAGTCRVAGILERRGYAVTATDLSSAMLGEGARRVRQRAAADFRRLPFRAASFDAVLCLYDATNYNLGEDDLLAFFTEARRVVRGGGLLILDVTTAENSRKHFAGAVQHEIQQGASIVRESHWDGAARMQHNVFTFFLPAEKGLYARFEEHHQQRIWPQVSLKTAARAAGWKWVAALDDMTMRPAVRRSERIHIVLRA